ncbi:efflux RND transporter permease subunit, partial [Rubrivivax albus]
IAGLGALRGVELRELPNVDRPIVAVRADFPGAAPETLDAEVTRVLEADAEPVIQLAVASRVLSVDQLTRAVEEQLEPELVAVPGVADVTLFGGRETVMRGRLDPARLAARNVAVDEGVAALRRARADVPAGSLQGGELQ